MTTENVVLIVGSGPTGMTMACRLVALGVPVRLIDRLPEPVPTSRAFTIHARTLELLGQMGLTDTFLTRSLKTYSMDYHFPNKPETPKLDFTALDSVFPFCLTINQADTETILRDHFTALGGTIEWNTRLESFSETGEDLQVVLRHLDTETLETIRVDWLIGCDGFYSTVRQQLNIPFDGSEYAGTMRMIDVPVTGFEESDHAIHYFIAKEHMLLINKLPGPNYRVLISDKTEGVPPEEARASFQAVLDQHFGGNVQLGDPVWSTNFRLSRRQVDTYRRGNVFLAGDAAHVNSPAGGQGMNVAIQDAFNLSWKLAMVIKGEAKESLLNTYEIERRPVAKQMLEGTSYIHSIIMAHGQGMAERIERMQGGAWNKRAVNQVAGISYTYRADREAGAEEAAAVLPLAVGDRAPDGFLSGQQRIYDLIGSEGYTLFLFLAEAGDRAAYDRLETIAGQAAGRTKTKIKPWIVVSPTFAAQLEQPGPGVVVDHHDFRRRYDSLAATKAVIVRPDCHLAYAGLAEEPASLWAALARDLL